jgi:hypothetical protein
MKSTKLKPKDKFLLGPLVLCVFSLQRKKHTTHDEKPFFVFAAAVYIKRYKILSQHDQSLSTVMLPLAVAAVV